MFGFIFYSLFYLVFLIPAIGLTYWSVNMIEGLMGVSFGVFLTGLVFIAVAIGCYYLHNICSLFMFGMLCSWRQCGFVLQTLLFVLCYSIILFGAYQLGMLGLSYSALELQNQTAIATIFAFAFLVADNFLTFRLMSSIP